METTIWKLSPENDGRVSVASGKKAGAPVLETEGAWNEGHPERCKLKLNGDEAREMSAALLLASRGDGDDARELSRRLDFALELVTRLVGDDPNEEMGWVLRHLRERRPWGAMECLRRELAQEQHGPTRQKLLIIREALGAALALS